jgi:ubiquinone/menaquinone biosynthesis C-methylase UbiE
MALIYSFLRLFFQHLYTTFAWAYDFVAATTSIGQWSAWQQVALDRLPDEGHVLELGHGPGHLLKLRATQGQSDIGVDSSPQMIRIAARRLRRAGYPAKLVHARAEALPFASNSFRAVYATFPSEYIVAPQSLASLHRVLDHGGSIIVIPMARITGTSLLDRLAAWLYRITGQTREFETGWDEFLQRAGFDATLDQIRLPRSLVYRLIAKKRG